MENKYFKVNHQGPGWDHFKARDVYKKNILNLDQKNEKGTIVEKNIKKKFSWIMDTINPLNHIPLVSSIKNFITKSNKSLDIIQSAVGGFIFAGPLGILKGLGGWAANNITNKFIAANSSKGDKRSDSDKKLDSPNHQPGNNKVNSKKLSFNLNNSKNENSNFASNSAQFTNSYINNYKILTKKNPANLTLKNYLDIKTHKNKINTSA